MDRSVTPDTIRRLIRRCGRTPYPGSSLKAGIPYQPIPFPEFLDIPAQRPMATLEFLAVLKHCHARGSWPGRVLDYGANIGMHTLLWAQFGARVYAVEADPANLKVLTALAAWANLSDRVIAVDRWEAVSRERFDLALCLNVHQWVYQALGPEKTKRWLRAVASRSRAVVFQTAHAGSHGRVTVPSLKDRADCIRYLRDAGKNHVTVLGPSGYKHPRWMLWGE